MSNPSLWTQTFKPVQIAPPSPFNEGDLGAPIVEGSRDEDLLASISPADDSGTSLLGWLDWIIQVRLPRHKILVPRKLQQERKKEKKWKKLHLLIAFQYVKKNKGTKIFAFPDVTSIPHQQVDTWTGKFLGLFCFLSPFKKTEIWRECLDPQR